MSGVSKAIAQSQVIHDPYLNREIGAYLPSEDLPVATKVCTLWRQCYGNDLLDRLNRGDALTTFACSLTDLDSLLNRMGPIVQLNLSKADLSSDELDRFFREDSLDRFNSLQTLCLGGNEAGCLAASDVYRKIFSLPNLKSLDLNEIALSEASLTYLSTHLRGLEELMVSSADRAEGCDLFEERSALKLVSKIRSLSQLKKLHIPATFLMFDELALLLRRTGEEVGDPLPLLEELNLSQNPGIADGQMWRVLQGRAHLLRSLNVEEILISEFHDEWEPEQFNEFEEGMRDFFARATHLEELNISSNFGGFSEASWNAIAQLPLKKLYVRSMELTPSKLGILLSQLGEDLEELDLSDNCECLKGVDMEIFFRFPHLKTLNLEDVELQPEQVMTLLEVLPDVRGLRLSEQPAYFDSPY